MTARTKLIAFGLPGAFVLMLGAGLWIRTVADFRLEREVDAIRAAGGTLVFAELAPPPLPDEENAAILLARADGVFVEFDGSGGREASKERFVGDPFAAGDGDAAVVAAWVEANEAAIRLSEAAAECPGGRFVTSYSDPLRCEMPALRALISVARLLPARALLRARQGRAEEAFADIARTLRLASHVEKEPVLALHAMRLGVEEEALRALERILARHDPPEGDRQALADLLDRIDERASLRRALLGERAFGSACFGFIADGLPPDQVCIPPSFSLMPEPVLRLDEARYLGLMSRAVRLLDDPWPAARGEFRALDRSVGDGPWYARLSKILCIGFGDVVDRSTAHRARLDLARIALSIEAEGESPEPPTSFGEGSRRSPIDPFTGGPYLHRKTDAGGFIRYSPGPDGVDDGGRDGSDCGYASGDVTWRRLGR